MLEQFLEDYGAMPWSPGEVDCTLMLADWWIACGRVDAAAGIRGAYADEAGYQAIIARYGSLSGLIDACAPKAGGRRTDDLQAGCIGVIGSRTDVTKQFGAIFDGSRWRLRNADGVRAIAARPLAIWDLTCQQP